MLIVCCGMIRSGSTLQYNLLRNLVEVTASGRGEGFTGAPHRDHRLHEWRQDRALHVIKTHDTAEWMFDEQALSSIRFFYSHRDLRDVAASAKRKFGWSSPQIWKALDSAIRLQRRLETIRQAQIHRYAQLFADPCSCLEAMASFIDLPLSDDVRSQVISACSIERAEKVQIDVRKVMSVNGVPVGGDNKASVFDQTTLLHHNHISPSRGRDGAWRQQLTANDLLTLNSRYGDWLQGEGYIHA